MLLQEAEEPKRKDNLKLQLAEGVVLGTWNLRGTFHEGATKVLNCETYLYGTNVLALEETKQKQCFETELEHYIFLDDE